MAINTKISTKITAKTTAKSTAKTFGNSVTKTINQKNFEQNTGQVSVYDWYLVGLLVLICSLGLAFLASSLAVSGSQDQFFNQLFLGVGVGSVVAFLLARTDYHTIFKYKNWILGITVSLLLFLAFFSVMATFLGVSRGAIEARFLWLPIRPQEAGGAIRWIVFPHPLPSFQPSDLAKIALLIYFSGHLLIVEKAGFTWASFKKPFYAFGLVAFLVFIQPDLGTVLNIFGILFSALWASGRVSLKFLAPVLILVMLGGSYLAVSENYRAQRVNAFLETALHLDRACAPINLEPNLYQICQTVRAASSGGLWGKGYGNSEFKQARAIPEISNDAIIGLIGEEMGFIFVIFFLSIYLLIFWRGLKIANSAPDSAGKALAIGISVWIISQAFLNVAGITGLVPLKGLPLPFVSRGGSAMLISLAAMGILLNISKQSQLHDFNTQSNKGFFSLQNFKNPSLQTFRYSKKKEKPEK